MLIDTQIYKISFPNFPFSWIFFTFSLSGTPFPSSSCQRGGYVSVLPSHPTHLCSSVGLGLPSGHSSEGKEREQKTQPLFTLFRHRIPLPSSFGQREGLFLGVLGAHFAQQQGNAMSRAGFTLGQRGKKRKNTLDIPSHTLVFRDPISQSSGQKEEIFFLNFLLSSLIIQFLDLTYLWIKAKN